VPPKTPEQLWYAHTPGWGVRLARALLWPVSGLWWAGSNVHRGMYSLGVRQAVTVAGVRVVKVGNVVTGGAGKTPTVMALAQAAVAAGLKPAILCRGYGANPPPTGICVGPDTPVALSGDEPWMMAAAMPELPVFAGRDRVALARAAVDAGATLLLLDDGMQHHRLHAHGLVAVVRGPDPFGNGLLLPAGPLRETAHGLARADLVVVLEGTADTLARVHAAGVARERVVCARLVPLDPVALDGQGPLSLEGRRVVVAAGLARPSRVVTTVAALGASVTHLVAWPDHAVLGPAQVQAALAAVASHGANTLVMTEKDAVKWPRDTPVAGVRVVALPVRLRWDTPAVPPAVLSLLGAAGLGQ
jgi:tetraacyldisaccharide 4'-kinase